MNWSDHLDEFGRSLLRHLDVDPNWLPTNTNPVTAPAPVQPSTTKQSRPWTERK